MDADPAIDPEVQRYCLVDRHYSSAVKIACFRFKNSLRFARETGISVDSPIMYITIIRRRTSACSLEKPASENIQAATEKRLFSARLNTRLAIIDEDVWPPPATEKPQLPDPTTRIPYSDTIVGGKLDVKDVLQPTYDAINKEYGINEKQD